MLLAARTDTIQMLQFKTTKTAAARDTAAGHVKTAYKVVPERSTLAMVSGLDRLFGISTSDGGLSRESSLLGASGEQHELEASGAQQRRNAKALSDVQCELDEYLEEPLETFRKTEIVDGHKAIVVSDVLAYWQVRVFCPHPFQMRLTSDYRTRKKGFQTCFTSQWMSCPHRQVRFRANVSSRRARKRVPLAGIGSGQNLWKPCKH